MHFEVSKLRDREIRDTLKLTLHNRFETLQQLIEKEMKRRFRRSKRVYVEAEAERAEEAGERSDVETLHEITTRLSRKFQSTCKPVGNEAGVLLRSIGGRDATL